MSHDDNVIKNHIHTIDCNHDSVIKEKKKDVIVNTNVPKETDYYNAEVYQELNCKELNWTSSIDYNQMAISSSFSPTDCWNDSANKKPTPPDIMNIGYKRKKKK